LKSVYDKSAQREAARRTSSAAPGPVDLSAMRRENHPICFQCGQRTGDLTRFNRLHDGRACPACAERLLAGLPSLLPRRSAPTELAEALENDLDASDDSDFEPGA